MCVVPGLRIARCYFIHEIGFVWPVGSATLFQAVDYMYSTNKSLNEKLTMSSYTDLLGLAHEELVEVVELL